MWCYVSFLQPGSHPVRRANSPGAADHSWDSHIRLLIILTHFNARAHTGTHGRTHTHICQRTLASKDTHSYKAGLPHTKTLTYVPSFISALLSLFVSQLCRCFSHGDMNTKFAQILFPVVWFGTVGFEMIMNLWARISHMAPCLVWKQKK